MIGFVRTTLLIFSPRRLVVSAKNFLLWRRLRKDPEARTLWNEYFDPVEYERNHPDVSEAGVNPWVHFLLCGNEDLRIPSLQFDTSRYLRRYPDVRESGVNALLHFALFGSRENRFISRHQVEPVLAESGREPSPVMFVNNEWLPDRPLVSVVIPCFNYGHHLEEAIHSVLSQTFTDLEIIVVEGGSTNPASVAEVRRLESLGLPKTRFYYRTERHLAGDNRNFGIGMARGRYICCLDADDMLQPVYIEIAVFLAEAYGFDLITSAVQNFGGSDAQWLIVSDPAFPQILEWNQVATTALFRRSAWAHTGGYRDWGLGSKYVSEDWEFWVRILGHGAQATSIAEPLLSYRVHGDSLSRLDTPQVADQQKLIQAANAGLAAENQIQLSEVRRQILNPWTNLGPLEDGQEGILLALPCIIVGGAETLFRTIASIFKARGYRVIVTTSLTLPKFVPENTECFKGVTDHVYHLSRLFKDDEHQRDFLLWLVRRYSIRRMIVAGSVLVYRLLPDLKREFPQLTVIDQLFNDSVHVRSNRQFAKYIDGTVVPSEQLRSIMIEKHHADASTVHVVPHAVEQPPQVELNGQRPFPGIEPDQIVVAFFGRMSEEKGPDLFVEIARALGSHKELYFVMTGEGPEREKVLRKIKQHGLEKRIYAPGFVADVFPLMHSADIVVVPSRLDGMPLVVLESQALGKAVIASRVGSLPAMIQDEESGFLCERGDIDAFCRRILQLAGDPELRNRVREAARRSFAERHDAQQMVDGYERAFSSAQPKPREVRTTTASR